MESFRTWMETFGIAVDAVCVLIMILRAVSRHSAICIDLRATRRTPIALIDPAGAGHPARTRVPIAGDIIRTVAIEPTLTVCSCWPVSCR